MQREIVSLQLVLFMFHCMNGRQIILPLTASRRDNGWRVARQRAFRDAMDASDEGTGWRAGD
jgi:hypothetical protein